MENIDMQKFLTSSEFTAAVKKAEELAGSVEAGFLCYYSEETNEVFVNTPVVGGKDSIPTHFQGGKIYSENEGFFEGKDKQIGVCMHFHPNEETKEWGGIKKIFPSCRDLFFLFFKMVENRNIASGDRDWLNPIGYLGCPSNDKYILYQWRENLVLKKDIEDHFSETLDKFFKMVFKKEPQVDFWFHTMFALANEVAVVPPFIRQYPKRYFEFLDLVGVRNQVINKWELGNPEKLKDFRFWIP